MKRRKTLTLLTALFLIIAVCGFVACDSANSTPEQPQASNAAAVSNQNDPIAIGEGSKAFLFKTTDGDGNTTTWNVHTNETTVGDALVKVGLIDGTTSDFGLMVSHVNGIRADYVEDDAWWAFYIDDEMAMAGVDSTEIEEGVVYSFIHTPA